MTRFTLSPGYARVSYSGVTSPHHFIVPLVFSGVVTPGTLPDVFTKSSGAVDANTGLVALIGAVKPMFAETTTFGLYEIHAVTDDEEAIDSFVCAGDLNTAGTNVLDAVPFSRLSFNYKTQYGHPLHPIFMESVYVPNQVLRPPIADAALTGFNDYMTGNDCIWHGRDGAFAYGLISIKTKTDDVLRRRGQTG